MFLREDGGFCDEGMVGVPGTVYNLVGVRDHSNVVDLHQSPRPDINVWATFTKPASQAYPLRG